MVGTIMKFTSPWMQCLMLSIFCLSGCCCGCCCCCCCCCNFCFGKCAPELKDMEDIPDVTEFEGADAEDDDVVTNQPGMERIGIYEFLRNGSSEISMQGMRELFCYFLALKIKSRDQTCPVIHESLASKELKCSLSHVTQEPEAAPRVRPRRPAMRRSRRKSLRSTMTTRTATPPVSIDITIDTG